MPVILLRIRSVIASRGGEFRGERCSGARDTSEISFLFHDECLHNNVNDCTFRKHSTPGQSDRWHSESSILCCCSPRCGRSTFESLKLTTIPRINGCAEVFRGVKLFGALARIKLSLSELHRRRNLGKSIRIATTRTAAKLSEALRQRGARCRLDLEFLAVSQLSGIL